MKSLPDFGFAVYNRQQLKKVLGFSGAFPVEISGDMLEDTANLLLEYPKNEVVFSVRDICAVRVFRELPLSSFAVKQDFFKFFSARCALMHELAVDHIFFAPDIERMLNDRDYEKPLRDILLNCFGIAAAKGLRCGLEVRVPGAAVSRLEEFCRFRELLNYPVAIQYKFHPHENNSFEQMEVVASRLSFDRFNWRIFFDAGSGNYLGSKVISRLLPLLQSRSWRSPEALFDPGENADEMVFDQLLNMLQSLPKQE